MAINFVSRNVIVISLHDHDEEFETSLSKDQILALQAFCVIGRDQGNKIATIKAINSILGCGLKFAKDFMEQSLPVEIAYRNNKIEAWHVLPTVDRY